MAASYNKCQNESCVCGILDIEQIYLSSNSQVFQKFQGETNISNHMKLIKRYLFIEDIYLLDEQK